MGTVPSAGDHDDEAGRGPLSGGGWISGPANGGPAHPAWCDPNRCTATLDTANGVHRSAARRVPPRGHGAVVATLSLLQAPSWAVPEPALALHLISELDPPDSIELTLAEARQLAAAIAETVAQAARR